MKIGSMTIRRNVFTGRAEVDLYLSDVSADEADRLLAQYCAQYDFGFDIHTRQPTFNGVLMRPETTYGTSDEPALLEHKPEDK